VATFLNPVIDSDLADPTIIRVGDTYYSAGSSYNWEPIYPIYKSDDLVNWTQVGNVFGRKPEWSSTGFWAPEFFQHNGKFYCYYSAGRESDGKHCLCAAVAGSPEGPYTDLGVMLDSGTEQIDSYMFDDDGQLYVTWKAHGLDKVPDEIACSKVADDGFTLYGEPFTIVRDDERLGMEGQCMFKRNGWYYILYSAKSCCGPGSNYEVRLARSKSVEGEWEKYPGNPILAGNGEPVQALGHGSVVETPDGRLFYLCHAYLTEPDFFLSRRPFLSELVCTEDGWVACTTGSVASVIQNTPFPGTIQQPRTCFEDDFKSDTLAPSWSRPIAHPSLAANSLSQTTFIRCQRPFKQDYNVTLSVKEGAAALKGLIFFGSFADFVTLAVEGETIVLRSAMGDVNMVLRSWPIPEGDISFHASVEDAVSATFSWSAGETSETYEETVQLTPLMRWDSSFRVGIVSSEQSTTPFSHFMID